MDAKWLMICVGAIVGWGLGRIVGENKCDRLEAERDELDLRNKCLTAECELTQMCNDNLKATNELLTNLLLQENEDEGS